jgi:hypothetical protein
MIRVIVATADACMAANVGGPVHVDYRSFEIDAPELEAFLAEQEQWKKDGLCQRSIVGVEAMTRARYPE